MIPWSFLNGLHRELESAVSPSLEGVVLWVVRKFVDLTVVDSESGSNLKLFKSHFDSRLRYSLFQAL